MKWLLIIVWISSHGAAASSTEFNSKYACEIAANKVKQTDEIGFILSNKGEGINVFCTEKGN